MAYVEIGLIAAAIWLGLGFLLSVLIGGVFRFSDRTADDEIKETKKAPSSGYRAAP